MIFTLFLICAFNVQNACTVSSTPYVGLAACPQSRENAGCYTECEDACLAEDDDSNAGACEAGLDCFDGTTNNAYITGATACGLADPGGDDRVDCVKACYDHCEANSGAEKANAPCKTAIPCYDAATLGDCQTFCAVPEKEEVTGTVCVDTIPCLGDLTDKEVVADCIAFCAVDAKKSATTTLCGTSLPCQQANPAKTLTEACGAIATGLDCLDQCAAGCAAPASDPEKAACLTAVKCSDVSDGTKKGNCKGFCTANATKSAAALALCNAALVCDEDFGLDVCGLYMDDEEGDGCTLTECNNWCASTKPGYDTANCTTQKALCTSAPCDNLPDTTEHTGCMKSHCATFCRADAAAANKTKCEATLPCWDGSLGKLNTALPPVACARFHADSTNAECGTICAGYCTDPCAAGQIDDCYPECDEFCSDADNADEEGCEVCEDTGADACEGSTWGCIKACATYCTTTASADDDNCEECKTTNAATCGDSNPRCKSLCTAFCAISTNAEDAACKDPDADSSFGVVASLVVLLFALL